MGKAPRVDSSDLIYHVWNRANGRATLFESDSDYRAFEAILEETKKKIDINIYAYCIMPNHWHFVLQPKNDGELSRFVGLLTLTHTQRLHAFRGTVGQGHVYQGPYKANICQEDEHFIQLARYVERNAVRAGLCELAQDWRWSSAWRRYQGSSNSKHLLSEWPLPEPNNYVQLLNMGDTEADLSETRERLKKNAPFGDLEWRKQTAEKLGLASTLRARGRPRKTD